MSFSVPPIPEPSGFQADTPTSADLRQQLVSLQRLPPREPVSESEIAEAYGVSRTPREAILKLADEGLLEIFPQFESVRASRSRNARGDPLSRRALEETTAVIAASPPPKPALGAATGAAEPT